MVTHSATFALEDDDLDALRLLGDPEADALVVALYPKGREAIVSLNRAMAKIINNNDPLPESMPAELRAFLSRGSEIGRVSGGWDGVKMRRGSRFYRHYSVHISILLQISTMPMLYAGAKGVEVLVFTERLEKYAHRRSLETAQMVFDAMAFDGFEPSGMGRRSIQKVRLMHAGVRRMIDLSGRWDHARLGVPINQEDMLATLGGFCTQVIEGLEMLGSDCPAELVEGFYYRWRAISVLLGIPEAILAPDVAGARAQFDVIRRRQIAPSEGGRRLMRSWLETMEVMTPHPRLYPYIRPAMRLLIGDHAADVVGLERDPARMAIFEANRFWLRPPDRYLPHGGLPRRGFDAVLNAALQTFYIKDRGLRRPGFALPMKRRS